MNNRLLFAAARGARIHYGKGLLHTELISIDPTTIQSIHPDDEPLQYGPISTELRESAVDPWSSELTFDAPYGGRHWLSTGDWLLWNGCDDKLHRSLFLLIMAEALADEGL